MWASNHLGVHQLKDLTLVQVMARPCRWLPGADRAAYLRYVQLAANLGALAAAHFVGVDGLVSHKACHFPRWMHEGLAGW
jgi:hypothetical protein